MVEEEKGRNINYLWVCIDIKIGGVFIFKFVEISVFVEKLYFFEILRNNSCIYDGER